MFYNQGTQRIEVIVRKETSGGLQGAKETSVDEITADGTKPVSGSGCGGLGMSNIRLKRLIKTNVTHGLSAAHQVFDLRMNNYLGGIGYINGDQNYQDSLQRKMERVQDVSNFATSVAMGAAYGSWGGPIGAAFGAAFGAVTTGASIKTKYDDRQRDYDYKMFRENNAIEYNRARANINLTTGRLR